MKKYLMQGAAAMVLGLAVTSCAKDFTFEQEKSQQVLENAESTLGFEIPEGQNWVMSSQATANVAVNGDYQANYEVIIYSNNPFINNTGDVLAKGNVTSGNVFTTSFRYPTDMTTVYAAIRDEKGYLYVKPAAIIDGVIEAKFGGAAAKTRSLTQSAADDFVIPTYAAPDLASYAEDATPITAENNTSNSTVRKYIIPAGTTFSDFIPLLSASDPNDNSIVSVYVLGTLNVNESQRVNGGYGGAYKIIVGNGGVINIAKDVTLSSNANQNSGYVGEIQVLAGGKIQGEGKLEFSNGTNSYSYNGGTIDVGTINVNGGTLYNVGTLKADVMMGGGGLSTYINRGRVKIGSCAYGSGSSCNRVLNNCWWEVEDYMFARNIVQGAGAYMHVGGNFETSCGNDGTGEESYIYLKANSLMDVEGAAAFNNVDVVGPTASGDYAYMQFGWIESENGAHGIHVATNYTGWPDITCGAVINNIRLSVDNQQSYGACAKVINEMLNGSAGQGKQIGTGGAEVVKKGEYNVAVVDSSECSPGINPGKATGVKDSTHVWTYAFEDNTVKGDYDMNDVVLKVSEDPNDDTKLIVKLVAAGCEYENHVYLGNTEIKWTNASGVETSEVHEAFGVDKGTLVNTGTRLSVTKAVVSTTISKPANFDFQTADFNIVPSGGNDKDSHIRIATSGAPCGIVVPLDWKYPTERTNICDAYNTEGHSFQEWAESTNHTVATDWYNNPSGSVVE